MNERAITAAAFSDWLQYAGLYLDNFSHADRYRTFQTKVSATGLTAKIVFDFLESQSGSLDLQAWRNGNVYEVGADAAFRVEATAHALEAVGAVRAAARIRTLRDNSLLGALTGDGDVQSILEKMKDASAAQLIEEFRAKVARALPELAAQSGLKAPDTRPVSPATDIESKERIEQLLDQYVDAHQAELRGDYARHGDVRAAPDFDPAARKAELERQRLQKVNRQLQVEDVEKMSRLMAKLEPKPCCNPADESESVVRARGDLIECYRKYARRAATELLPTTQAWLREAEAFQERFRAVFRPAATGDAVLLERLAGIGQYDVDRRTAGLDRGTSRPRLCAWTKFRLHFRYPAGRDASLRALLDAYDQLCRDFPRQEAAMRQQIFESYETYRGWAPHRHPGDRGGNLSGRGGQRQPPGLQWPAARQR